MARTFLAMSRANHMTVPSFEASALKKRRTSCQCPAFSITYSVRSCWFGPWSMSDHRGQSMTCPAALASIVMAEGRFDRARGASGPSPARRDLSGPERARTLPSRGVILKMNKTAEFAASSTKAAMFRTCPGGARRLDPGPFRCRGQGPDGATPSSPGHRPSGHSGLAWTALYRSLGRPFLPLSCPSLFLARDGGHALAAPHRGVDA